MNSSFAKAWLVGLTCIVFCATAASARSFNIPSGSLEQALDIYMAQTGVSLIIADDHVKGARTKGAAGNFSDDAALARILLGTGFAVHSHPDGALAIRS